MKKKSIFLAVLFSLLSMTSTMANSDCPCNELVKELEGKDVVCYDEEKVFNKLYDLEEDRRSVYWEHQVLNNPGLYMVFDTTWHASAYSGRDRHLVNMNTCEVVKQLTVFHD